MARLSIMLNEGLTGFVACSLPCTLPSLRREQQLHFQGHGFALTAAKTTAQGLRDRTAERHRVGRILIRETHKSNVWERCFCAEFLNTFLRLEWIG